MGNYLDDILLILSLIGAPMILGTLLYYGIAISERRHHDRRDGRGTEVGPRKPQPEPERRDKDRSTERSSRSLELAKHRTGTSG